MGLVTWLGGEVMGRKDDVLRSEEEELAVTWTL